MINLYLKCDLIYVTMVVGRKATADLNFGHPTFIAPLCSESGSKMLFRIYPNSTM